LAKDDFSSVMKVLMENFAENIRDQIPESAQLEQYHYKQEQQEKEEDELRKLAIQQQQQQQKGLPLISMK
jgi:glycosylphosphatidylinositol transamidase (GPIT) subunit GPI8